MEGFRAEPGRGVRGCVAGEALLLGNRALLASAGLNAAVADSTDKEFMAVVKTVELLKNDILYAASYLDDILGPQA